MKFTDRQRFLLANLHRIAHRRKASGRTGYFFAKDDCTGTINSLIVKGVLTRSEDGRVLKLAAADQLPF